VALDDSGARQAVKQRMAVVPMRTLRTALHNIWSHVLDVLCNVGRWLWHSWVNHKRRVVMSDWTELEFSPAEVRADREAVLAAVCQDWRALEFAAEELRDDRVIVEQALNQSWRSLRYASRVLRSDRELVLCAVKQSSGWALEFAAEELYQDTELMQEATSRLGGRLGLPLSPIATLMPEAEPEADSQAQAADGETNQEATTMRTRPGESMIPPGNMMAPDAPTSTASQEDGSESHTAEYGGDRNTGEESIPGDNSEDSEEQCL